MSLETHAFLQAGADFYLGPFSKVSLPEETLTCYLAPVWAGEQALSVIWRTSTDEQREKKSPKDTNGSKF